MNLKMYLNSKVSFILGSLLLAVTSDVRGDGGISGGGGGTLPADPSSISQITDIVQLSAKRDLRLYLNLLENLYIRRKNDSFSSSYINKLFNSPQCSLGTILETTGIDLRKEQPCFDAEGKEVDGSIYGTPYADQPKTICISAFRIAPKVSEDAAYKETLALILHELGHLCDLNEEEATEFQKASLRDLKNYRDPEIRKFLMSSEESLLNLNNYLGSISAQYQSTGFLNYNDFLVSDLGKLRGSFFSYRYRDYDDQPKALLSAQLSDAFDALGEQFFLMTSYMICHSQGNAVYSNPQFYCDTYRDTFKDKMELKLNELSSAHQDNLFAEYRIKKINNEQELILQVKQLKDFIHQLDGYVQDIFFDRHLSIQPMIQLLGMTASVDNPWKKFLGRYQVLSSECENDTADDTQFEIFERDGRVLLKKFFQNGSAEYSLEAGEQGSIGTIEVSGGLMSVQKTEWNGHSWARQWYQTVQELRRVSQSELILKDTYFSGYYGRLSKSECVYRLINVM